MKTCLKNQMNYFLKPYLYVILAVAGATLVKKIITNGSVLEGLRFQVLPYLLGFCPGEREFLGIYMDSIGPIWFFLVFTLASILLNAVMQEKELYIQCTIIAMLGIAGVFLKSIILPYCIIQTMICSGYMFCGMLMKKYKFLEKQLPGYFILGAIAFCLWIGTYGNVEISQNVWELGTSDLIVSYIAGLVLFKGFMKLNCIQGAISEKVRWMGRHALWICCIHTVFYTVVPWDKIAVHLADKKLLGFLIEFVLQMGLTIGICHLILLTIQRRKTVWKRIVVGILILIITIGVILLFPRVQEYYSQKQYYDQFKNIPEKTVEYTGNPINQDDFLVTDGNRIINKKGEEVVFEGINLGGWLLQEYWMCPIEGDPAVERWTNQETLQVLKERFGLQKAQELAAVYEDNWITEWDIKKLASIGVNTLRVPFWYLNFMSDPEGDWLTENVDDNPGVQRLDWVIETAGKYGMYIILDMHGCPGGQSLADCTGTARQCELFHDEAYQSAMERLWVEIAKRYAGNPVVAAYDIMNEPESFECDVSSDPRNILYDRMIKAIRTVDSEHIITVEAMWNLSVLPDPTKWGWENVVYQVHPYGKSDTKGYCRELLEYSNLHSVPIYVGEFSDLNMLEECRNSGLSYTSWTYKGTTYAEGSWYMYQNFDVSRVDVYNDPYWLIKMKWGKCLSTQFFEENEEVFSYWSE